MKLGKRESQRLARRAQIVAIAREQFFEHGYEGTSMSAIAAALGGSKGTLWSYFPSKEQLLVAVIDETAAGLRSGVDIGTQGTPLDALIRLCRSVIEKVTSPVVYQMQRLMAPVVERNAELARIFYDHGPGRTQLMIAEHLREHFGHLLWTDDPVEASRDLLMLAAAHYHFEKLWGIGKPITNQDKDIRARRAAIMFLRAHAKDPRALLGDAADAGPLPPPTA